jgi:hypothetical protein
MIAGVMQISKASELVVIPAIFLWIKTEDDDKNISTENAIKWPTKNTGFSKDAFINSSKLYL